MADEQSCGERALPATARFVLLARSHPAVSLALLAGGAAAIYFLVVRLWPSDEREIRATVSAVTQSVVEGNVEGVLERVSPYFLEEGLDKHMLGVLLPRALSRRPVVRATASVRQLDVGAGRAASKVDVQSFHGEWLSGGFAWSEWLVTLEEIEGRWLIRTATPQRVNRRSVGGLRAVLALGF